MTIKAFDQNSSIELTPEINDIKNSFFTFLRCQMVVLTKYNYIKRKPFDDRFVQQLIKYFIFTQIRFTPQNPGSTDFTFIAPEPTQHNEPDVTLKELYCMTFPRLSRQIKTNVSVALTAPPKRLGKYLPCAWRHIRRH